MREPHGCNVMKILHVTPAFHPAYVYGGPIESVYQLCRHLAHQGSLVQVLTSNANGRANALDVPSDHDVLLAENLTVRYCHRVLGQMIAPRLVAALVPYVRKADVVHLTGVYSFPTIPTLVACRALNRPLVWSPRGSLQRWEQSRRIGAKWLWEAGCAAVAPKRLLIHVTSEGEAAASRRRFPSTPLTLIPNGVQIPETISPGQRNGPLRLLFLGRLDPIKGIENLLEACRILQAKRTLKWSLTIAGGGDSGYRSRLANAIRTSGLDEKVTMVGEVSGGEKARAFAEADALVVPSHSENFGIVVAEGLAHGIPVIASTGTPWSRLQTMGCGLWVDNAPESLVGAINKLSRMPLREMGRAGREWMMKEFSWARIAGDMRGCYETVLQGGGHAGL